MSNTTTSPLDVLLERVRSSGPVHGHDGRSGADIQRGVLDDGTAVVIKRSRREDDLVMLASNDPRGREAALWSAGVLDELPDGIAHCLLAAGWSSGQLVTVMTDLGRRVRRWDDSFTARELALTFDAVSRMHRRFAGRAPDGLCDLATRLTIFAPERVARLANHDNPMPRGILHGWERFVDQVDPEVADAVMAMLEDPSPLLDALAPAPTTLLHGDLTLVNVALDDQGVTLLDWSLATAGPAVIDLVCFLVSSGSRIDQSYDAQLDQIRMATGDWHDDNVLHAALFWGLLELGWNMALNAVDYPDPAERVIARRDLAWWIARARDALEAGALR